MRKRYEQAFLDGYKPSTIVLRSNNFFDQLQSYPSIHPFNNHPESYIFFQSEELKQEYIRKKVEIKDDTFEDHVLLGITLGFPRKSCEWFAKMRQLEEQTGAFPEEDTLYGIGISWAGFFFRTHVDIAIQEIKWLWNTYTSPKAVENPLYIRPPQNMYYYQVPYGNYESIKNILNKIRLGQALVYPSFT